MSGRTPGPQYAAFKFEKPIGDAANGLRLRIEMNQPRDKFSIAKFRIWVTTSAIPAECRLACGGRGRFQEGPGVPLARGKGGD